MTLSDGLQRQSYGLASDGSQTTYRLGLQGANTASGAAVVRSDSSVGWYSDSTPNVAEEVDNRQPTSSGSSFTENGNWKLVGNSTAPSDAVIAPASSVLADGQSGLGGNYSYTRSGGATATWQLTNLEPGKAYEIFTTWTAGPDRASSVQYTITGARPVDSPARQSTSILVDQRYVPGSTVIDNVRWRSLGFFVAGDQGTITVTLAAGNDGVTVADGVLAACDWNFATPAGSFNQLQTKNEGFSLRDKVGTIETFNGYGFVTDDLDRTGNRTQFTYASTSGSSGSSQLTFPLQLASVTEQGGLTTQFQYADGALLRG